MIPALSRELRRQVGPVAWAALADVIDDAALEAGGRLVAATNARRLAVNLGVSKDTAARALARLVAAGLLERVPVVRGERGRFGAAAYIIRVAETTAPPVPLPRDQRRRVPGPQPSLFEVP